MTIQKDIVEEVFPETLKILSDLSANSSDMAEAIRSPKYVNKKVLASFTLLALKPK